MDDKSSWRNRLARPTVNREVVGSIPTEDVLFLKERVYNSDTEEFPLEIELVSNIENSSIFEFLLF